MIASMGKEHNVSNPSVVVSLGCADVEKVDAGKSSKGYPHR